LEIRFHKFCLDKQLAESQINFGSIAFAILERSAGLEPKLRDHVSINAQKSVGIHSRSYFRVTEDVHKECVRAVRAIEFFPFPVGPRPCALVGSVDLIESSRPFPVVTNHFVSSRMKVPMPPFLIATKDDAGNLPVGEFMEIFVD
jgi:hypothetical protein